MERIGKLTFNRAHLIGSGKYGSVFRGTYRDTVNVAIKRLDKRNTKIDSTLYIKAHEHQNVIQYISTCNKDVEFRYLALEICAGNLEDLICGQYNGPKVGSTLEILRQIVRGVTHLHLLNIIHGDLKPSNILISLPKGELKPMMKLTDFGLRHVVPYTDSKRFRQASSKGWMCPTDTVNEGRLDPSFDIFPLAAVMGFTASNGTHPFGRDIREAILRIKKKLPIILVIEQLDQSLPGYSFLDLISKMLDFDSSKRPTAPEVLSHSIFNKKKQKNGSKDESSVSASTSSHSSNIESKNQLPEESNTSRPLKKKRKGSKASHFQPLSNEDDAMTNPKQSTASESLLTATKKREESDSREPNIKCLKVKKVAETTSKMSSTNELEGKRPSTASQTYEAPINPDPLLRRVKIERVDSDDSDHPTALANPPIIVKKEHGNGKNHEEMKVSFATPEESNTNRPVKKKRKAKPSQPLSNGDAFLSDAMANSQQFSVSESPLTATEKPKESDSREPSKKRLKDDQVAKTTSSMSSIYKSKEKRPSTASQTQEAPINPDPVLRRMKIERVGADDSDNPMTIVNPPVIATEENTDEKNPDEMKKIVKTERDEKMSTANGNTPEPEDSLQLPPSSSVKTSQRRVISSTENLTFYENNGKYLFSKGSFQCKTCGLRLNSEQSLCWHMNHHNGLTPFECDICHEKFATPSGLQKHRPKHRQLKISLKKKEFECTFCHRKFFRSNSLKKHRDGNQMTDGIILCPVRRSQLFS